MGKLFAAGSILVLVLGIFVTTYLAQQPQDLRSRASNEKSIDLSSPTKIESVQTIQEKNSTKVTWTTSKPTITKIEYGYSKDDLTNSINQDNLYLLEHSLSIPTTDQRRLYFRIHSIDQSHKDTISVIYNFKPS
jgi:hypothetical protein